jgi:glucose/mannose transport system substrate-binding protein
MRKKISAGVVICCAAALASGCGGTAAPSAPGVSDAGTGDGATTNVLDLFSWWVAPGEAEALQALVSAYKELYPKVRVSRDTRATAVDWDVVLGANIDKSPWDVVQVSQSGLASFVAAHPMSLAPVDEFYDEAALKAAVIPDILKAVTFDGHARGVVTGVHRHNAFLINLQIFAEQKLTPPTTMAEFLDVCAKLKAAGITPVVTSFNTWVLRFMLNDLLSGVIGAVEYDHYIQGITPASDENLKAGIASAVEIFAKVLNEYVDPSTPRTDQYDWAAATEALHSGKAAMMLHGDWAKGYLVHLGWTPGVDFAVSGPPGAGDLFVYGADTFALPAVAPRPETAHGFLGVVASKAAQVAFNEQKGSTPMRTDVRDMLDPSAKASLDDLMNAKVLMAGRDNSAWDDGIDAFLVKGDQGALVQVYLTSRPP